MKIKKALSFALSLTMISSALPSVFMSRASAAENWTARTNEVNLRMGIFADTHVGQGGVTGLENSITAINELSGGEPDAYIGLGDIVWFDKYQLYNDANTAKAKEYYDAAAKSLNKTRRSGVPIWQVMGNHEFPMSNLTTDVDDKGSNVTAKSRQMFVDEMLSKVGGQQTEVDFTTEINGYAVIGVSPDNFNDKRSTELEDWIKTEIDKAIAKDSTNANADGTFDEGVIPNSTKPVFYVNHHPITGARKFVYPFDDRYEIDAYTSVEFAEWIKTRPQVVSLYGHCHTQQQASGTVFQDGSTIIGVPLGDTGDGYSATHNTVIPWQTLYTAGQGVLVEIDKNNAVDVVKYDLTTKEYIGEPWHIDVPAVVADMTDDDPNNDTAHQIYHEDKRLQENMVAPVWKDNAEIEITNLATGAVKMKINDDDVILTETPNQQDDVIAGWNIVLKDCNGTKVFDENWDSGFYKWNHEGFTEEVLEGLGYGNTYTLEVSPVTVLAKKGETLTKTFTTSAEQVSEESVTFEAESYAKEAKNVYNYASAHDSKIYAAMQGGIIPNMVAGLTTVDPSFEFKFIPEKSGMYDIEYVMGKNNLPGNISDVTVYVNDTVLGNNRTLGDEDMSMVGYNENNKRNGSYAWGYISLMKYKRELELTAGTEYTVKFKIDPCQTGSYPAPNMLYMYAIDYIRFTPRDVEIPEGKVIKNLLRDENGTRLANVSISVSDYYGNATPSYGNGYGGVPENAVDGKDNTRWFPEFGHEYPYFQIDLGKPQNISKIVYKPWSSDGGVYWTKFMQIQASNYADFRTYATIKKCGDEGFDLSKTMEMNLNPNLNKYRYVRLVKGGGTTWANYAITELDVFGYEGDDTSVKEDMVESISNVKDGDVGLTNVNNGYISNPWGAAALKTMTYNGGKPIEIKFNQNVDMSSVSVNSVKLSKFDGATLSGVSYQPTIDTEKRTLKIDLSQLDQFVGCHRMTTAQYYQLDITSAVQNADGSVQNIPKSIKFTTHQIAKAPYVEGKEIKDVAVGKSARYKTAPAWGTIPNTDVETAKSRGLIGRYTDLFTNGGISDSSTATNWFGDTIEIGVWYHQIVKGNPVLIDLGASYDVVGLGNVVNQNTYDYWDVNHYIMSDPTYDMTGLNSVWNTPNVHTWTNSVGAKGTGRYILVDAAQSRSGAGQALPFEIMVYAYVDAETGLDAYLSSPVSLAEDGTTEVVTVTANAVGSGKLILAEYNADGSLSKTTMGDTAQNGKASVSYTKTEGKTYKMFLWDMANGMKPLTNSVEY